MRPSNVETLINQAGRLIDRGEAEILLAYFLNINRAYLLAHSEKPVNARARWRFNRAARQRQAGVPIAYLTHDKEFFGLNFYVDRRVLLPRPETETLVALALNELKTKKLKDYKIALIDVGTGSGCIPIAIIKTLKRKNIKTFATDISRPALRVAQKNAKKHDVKIKFLLGDLLAPIITRQSSIFSHQSSIIITANLPYLNAAQMKEPSIQSEPTTALYGGANGLQLYDKLLRQVKKIITCYLLPVTCLIEFDPSQTARLKNLIKKRLPKASVEIKKDLAGNNRVAIIQQ